MNCWYVPKPFPNRPFPIARSTPWSGTELRFLSRESRLASRLQCKLSRPEMKRRNLFDVSCDQRYKSKVHNGNPDELGTVLLSVTIGKFLRSIDYFPFRSFNVGDHFTFVIFSHPWPFCIGDRFDLVFVLSVAVIVRFAIWSVYSIFSCSFRDWDRWSLQRSPFVFQF